MFCKNCNQYMPDGSTYCPHCGCVNQPNDPFEAKKENQKTNRKTVVIVALIALVAILASVLVLIVYLQPPTAEEVYEMVSPSVVEITGVLPTGTSTGTGFFYNDQGMVITNYHVIENCTSASIKLASGATYQVDKVIKYSEEKDIALLSTNCPSSVPLQFRTTEIKTGEKVYAIGSSLGLEGTLSDGIISSASREVEGNAYIQTTAPISQGNSGGPLLDENGHVIGITTAYFADGQNLNLAIPIAQVETLAVRLPVTLDSLFKQKVEWISERDFFYYEDEDSFVLVFELSDENEVTMTSSGTVDIRIVNKAGVTVYDRQHPFSKDSFEEWIYDDTIEKYLASIYIDPNEIVSGTTSKGTVYFTVYGDDYSFDESTLEATGLPALPIATSVSVRTITLSEEADAVSIYNEWKNGVATENSLAQLMDEYGAAQGGGVLRVITPGEYVEQLNDWCFDLSRKVGDSAIIQNDYGYTIIYVSSISR